ncbi:MAG: ABC transporter substrate-binding protein [Cereibacter sphaeroides]|uniref:Probable sugar-binding periplasmic protein n=1 Tax=Cereibacter sphaeroides TaxID=1063 RepID=A0A2W5RYD8_CERSP|nr:MAG: ABC transporter substrate-binding protein [Cereibacter sphaeroides]
MTSWKLAAGLLASVVLPSAALATDLEVTHWWTSGGEAAAVAEFAKAFDATGNKWVDGAIAGSGDTARPIMVARITGGDPMGAFQFNHGRQAEELIASGLLRNLDDVAAAQNWKGVINPPSLLDSCTLDGHIYCVPVNIHAWQWLWLSNQAFADAGVPVPTNWDEFVAAGPALKAAGKQPLALGQQPWQITGLFNNIFLAVGGKDLFQKVYQDKDADTAAGPDMAKVFKAADDARQLAQGSNIQDWNQATNMVITGAAGGQSMGDWAQGEFSVAEKVAGKDYTCLPGLGMPDAYITTGGDSFYFPVLTDPEKTKAQDELATVMLSPETQVAFNLKKGSMPVRGDIDLTAANDCMKKGLEILAAGRVIKSTDEMLSPDTTTQLNDLMTSFFTTAMTPEEAQASFAELIGNAD